MRFDFSGAADLLETLLKMPELVSIGNAVQRDDLPDRGIAAVDWMAAAG